MLANRIPKALTRNGPYPSLLKEKAAPYRSILPAFSRPKNKAPDQLSLIRGLGIRSLTMTYSHMEKLHTTIGDASFHY